METASRSCAELLWKRSALGPKDIDCAQIYDAFTPQVVTGLEDYGFCKRGEGGPFTEGGRIEIGGELPVLTCGGGLSEAYVHGFNLLLEGIRQIRGASVNQVPGFRATLLTALWGDSGGAGVGRGDNCGRAARRMIVAEFVQDEQPLHPDYPLPDVDDPVMRAFWDGARDGKRMQQRDRTTGAVVWPPKPWYWK